MNSPDPVPPTLPWYRSPVLKGILIAVCAQVLLKVQRKWGIDLSQYGIDATALAEWVLNIVAGAALTWAAHSRITSPIQPVTLRKQPPDPSPPATPAQSK